LRAQELPECELATWANDSRFPPASNKSAKNHVSGRVRLRLLIGSPEQHHSDAEILPLPISSETFESIRLSWSMPQELLRMMLSTLPITTDFDAFDPSGDPVSGIMIRSARSRDWNFCMGLAYHENTGLTYAILNGMQAEEIDRLLRCLRNSAKHLFDPTILPLFLLELKVHYFAILLETRAEGIEKIELDTGMRHWNSRRRESKHGEREKLLKELNFDEITQKLTGVTGTLSFCDMTFASSMRALELVSKTRQRLLYDSSCARRGLDLESKTTAETRIRYVTELIIGAQAHSGVLSARTRAQVQTVS
jgi:hypothetical protein